MNIDKVYVSWTEAWDVSRYVEHYLRVRGFVSSPERRTRLLKRIEQYPGEAPFTRSSLDYYLDANGGKFE
jgi:hypothetical protein